MSIPTFLPRCPKCNEPLDGCGFPLPRKGKGRCKVGEIDVEFEADVDENSTVKDKEGNMIKAPIWNTNAENHN